ncbi:MAG: hypothetical protein NTZ26_12840 [Candidatus Aminicenantes bacterium]|nr:hypothetical protein [Candidatus Aminicenantes bacterium]
MKQNKRMVWTAAIGLILATACALAAPLAAGSEEDANICEKALMNCLADLPNGPLGIWAVGLKLAYCVSGNEFCRKYVAPFL